MNIFNRILAVLVLVTLLILVVWLAVFPLETLRSAQHSLSATSSFLEKLQTESLWIFTVARVLAVVLALMLIGLLLWGEVKPHRPRVVRVRTENGSQASVTTESVARRLAWHIDQLADVIVVTPEVTASGRSVHVILNLETRPEIDVPMKTDEIVAVTREVIVDRMGLQLGKIDVRIKHAPYQEEI